MSGDYSRHRFNPRNDYAGVKMQQGRVQLDADWNEQIAVQNRRTRAETVDTFGVAATPGINGVAVVSPQTPDAFLIEASAGNLTIGAGRMYVDGLLAENFGAAAGTQQFDPLLGELRGTQPLAYQAQPYHPVPPVLPGGGPHLAYLEVWQRELTHLQRPDLVEKAIAVDTTTRSQTVWQVRLLENIAATVDCSSPDADLPAVWSALIVPSAGRLSSRAEAVESDADPCELPPSGGYRGLENQLYRIEIHNPGGVGTATFKWSRDNASVAASVVEVVSSSELKLASLGRDAVLRFNTGDWVEILDDWRELSGEGGDPGQRFGVMRQISVDDAKQTISFATALPADLLPTGSGSDTLEQRHLRVIRWDQKGLVRDADDNLLVDLNPASSEGLIPVPAAGVWVHLEKGVQVQFSRDPGSGDFRCNDYWTVAARSADASVEILTNAPPQGIHRHYARLALVSFPDAETDCREHWPPSCGGCCTMIVHPGESIQAALDSLPAEGGCVCLKTGDHLIEEPLRIENSNIVLHGESPGTRVRRSNGTTLLSVDHPSWSDLENIRISGIHFQLDNSAASAALEPLVHLERCVNLLLEDCRLAAETQGNVLGIQIHVCTDLRVTQCRIDNVQTGLWVSGDSTRLSIAENSFSAPTEENRDSGLIGLYLEDAYGASHIKRNDISGFHIGVAVNRNPIGGPPSSGAHGTSISENRISRSTVDPFAAEEVMYAIDVAANSCLISDNRLSFSSIRHAGIRSAGSRNRVEGNWLYYSATNDGSDTTIGILQGRIGDDSYQLQGGIIQHNRLQGPLHGIALANMNSCDVLNNQIESATEKTTMAIFFTESDDNRIAGNSISQALLGVSGDAGDSNVISENRLLECAAGVTCFNQTALDITRNTLESPSTWGIGGNELFGKCSISENRLTNCGYQLELAFGIGVSAHLGELHIESNEIMNTGISPDGEQNSALAYGIWTDLILESRVQSNLVTYSSAETLDANAEHRALLARGYLDYAVNLGAGQLVFGFATQILDNKFVGPGRSALVELQQQQISDNLFIRFERVFFNNNYCAHFSVPSNNEARAIVLLHGRSAIVQGNHFKGLASIPSVHFRTGNEIYLGNIAMQGPLNFNGRPAPDASFNYP